MGRPNKPWYHKVQRKWVTKLHGEQVTLSEVGPKSKTRAAAMAAFHELMTKRKARKPRSSVLTYGALFDLFMDDCQRRLKPLTYEFYKRHLFDFGGYLDPTFPATEVRPLHVSEWMGARPKWNSTTRAGAITAVKRLFRWAKKAKLLPTNELADVEKPTPRVRETILTPAQAATVRAAAVDEAWKTLLEVLYESGMRPSEAEALEAAMIDWPEHRIVLDSKTTGATGRSRVIYMTPRLEEILRPLSEQHSTGPLLRNMRGRAWTRNAMACRFRRLRGKLGMGPEATADSFRHLFATDALEADVPIAKVAELLGHKGTAMVERHYSKLRDRREQLRKAAEQVRPGAASTSPHDGSRPEPSASARKRPARRKRKKRPERRQRTPGPCRGQSRRE